MQKEKNQEKEAGKSSRKILAGLVLFLGFMWVCTLVSRAVYAYRLPMVSTQTPERKYIEHIVEAEGIVVAGGEVPVTYLPGLRVASVSVRTGNRVAQGDVLFQIDLADLQELADKKKDEISKVSLQINAILENQELARQKKELELKRAREDYDITSRLENTQVGRAAESYVQAEQDVEEGKGEEMLTDALQSAAYGEADARAKRDEAIKEADRRVEDALLPDNASSDLETARLTLTQLQEELSLYQGVLSGQGMVTAGQGGVVTELFVKAGERLPDTAVLLLSDESLPCQLKVTLTKEQKKYVKLGDTVTLKLDGSSETENTVEYLAESQTMPGSYDLLFALPEGTGIPGMSGKLTCSSPGEKQPLCLPASAIYKADNRSYAYVLREREGILGMEYYVDEVTVKVRDENESWAAVEGAGLDGESRIIVSATKELKKGEVVRWAE